ncbi:MAG: EAL domain-containing protein [Pseudomonadota bacterium]
MRFRSLESRIATVFLVLILVIQVVSFIAIRAGIDANARAAIGNELAIGERVFRKLLEQNAEKLTQSARLLAADYGFRQAISTDDRETIETALDNHGQRINASLTMLVSSDRSIKAATTKHVSPALLKLVLQLVDQTEENGGASGTAIVDNLPYQIVAVPVKAPITIGWVLMAFPIDDKLAVDMRELSSLQVSILTRNEEGRWRSIASTLLAPELASLLGQLQAAPSAPPVSFDLNMAGSEFSARLLPLGKDAGQIASVLLQRSISEAIGPYRQLQLILLILTGLGIALGVAGSILTAKRIAQPLRALAESAKQLGTGNYQGRIDIQRDDEIGALGKAFDHMQDGIAKREIEIRRLAYWDSLTNLPNRAQFVTVLDEALMQAQTHSTGQTGQGCYVLMMDLDRFKHVNDVMGHDFGDALLCQVALRLTQQIDAGRATVARLGGDEFAILLDRAGLDEARQLAAKIIQSLEIPLSLDDQTVDLGAGLGIAGFPEHGNDAETLLSLAEVAMYAAKQRSNGAVVYDPLIDTASKQSLSMLSELRSAIDRNEFRLYVQPKLMLGTGKVVGLESLVRWEHPVKGFIFPDNFIPFAEQTGFIRVLTRWVLEQSAMLCRDLSALGHHLKVSVNLSTRDLLDQDLTNKFADILTRYQVGPASFCLEITESAIMDDPVRAQLTLEKLHTMGVDLSIDDFGTGYSSLAYLKRLPVDELKIDKSFVLNMELDAEDSKIVRSTIDLGHNMGLRVVAEGIESEAVWHLLSGMGCDQGQGYFMSRPMPADKLVGWLAQWQAPQHRDAAPELIR